MSERLEVSVSQLSRWEAGENNIPSKRLPELAEAYECRISDIFADDESDEIEIQGREVIEVPVLGLAPAGNWGEAIQTPEYTMKMAKPSAGRKIDFAVEIYGDSMDKLLPEGGWAAIDTSQRTLFDGRVYLVGNAEGDVTVKRYRENPARFEPVSHNSEHQVLFAGEQRITVIGRVVSYGNDQGL